MKLKTKSSNKVLLVPDISRSWVKAKTSKKLFLALIFMFIFLPVIAGCAAGHLGDQSEKAPSPSISAGEKEEDASLPVNEKNISTEANEDTFQLHLTRDWGKEVLDSQDVKIKPDYYLLDYLKEEWQITAGSGGFITGINGLQSASSDGNNYDWFFYVNGESSMVGASQVKPVSGDVIYWDYHMWSDSSGIIEDEGSFPPKEKDS